LRHYHLSALLLLTPPPPTPPPSPYTTLFRSHSSADRHRPADGRIAGRRPGQLPTLASGRPAERQLSNPSGHSPVAGRPLARVGRDRKSIRLNSSHVKISYAVFCLKKKKDILM